MKINLFSGQDGIVELLLRNNASLTIVNSDGKNARDLAAQESKCLVIRNQIIIATK